jgi:succinate dehydrogenase/fumarate reductase flavoprotein subunit
MLIYPTLHYQNGGLEFKATGETKVPGLFVAGEVGGGIHGENRLMGNSLLDIMVFGRISGRSAGQYALNQAEDGTLSLDHVVQYNAEAEAAGVDKDRIAPLLLPDYTLEHVKEKQLTAQYEGSIR